MSKIDNRTVGNDVAIVIGDRRISGWQTVSITRSAEAMPNSFVVTMTEEFSNDPHTILALPGDGVCKVMIGEDVVITGYVDRYNVITHPHGHDVQITGRGLCEDLVDCSIDLLDPKSPVHGGMISAPDAADLATKLCAAFGIKVRLAVADRGRPIRYLQVAAGETPYEVIERVCRYAAYLVYEDELGALVLDRVGTAKMASGFTEGENAEAAASTLSIDRRYSDYAVIFGTISQAWEGAGVDPTLKRAGAVDPTLKTVLKRYRPLIIVSPQAEPYPGWAQSLANWEMARRRGRSQAVQLTCDSWRDKSGKLWQVNHLAPVHLPQHKLVNAEWLIGAVTYRKDSSGTHADLVLMPPDAYSPQPTVLNLWDREIAAGQPGAAPAPAAPPPGVTGPDPNAQ
jgi:prophage tail gpP-like protein